VNAIGLASIFIVLFCKFVPDGLMAVSTNIQLCSINLFPVKQNQPNAHSERKTID
jgi:hypothetical protein